jgi:hypothetical protein
MSRLDCLQAELEQPLLVSNAYNVRYLEVRTAFPTELTSVRPRHRQEHGRLPAARAHRDHRLLLPDREVHVVDVPARRRFRLVERRRDDVEPPVQVAGPMQLP